jgi:transcriptional regulator with XRE-family HTH domain
MTMTSQVTPTTKSPHFATLLVMALAPGEIGARIAVRRKELGWTHQKLADEMDVELRTVQRWQKGVLPRLGKLMELADVMGVERSYFVEEAPPQESPQELASRLESLESKVTDGFEALEAAIEHIASQLRRPDAR